MHEIIFNIHLTFSIQYLRENSFYSLDEYFERKVKFWHMIWIDTWGFWGKCSFSNEGKFPT